MDNFLTRLQHITQMHFTAESLAGSMMGWNGQGSAAVTTECLCVNGVSTVRMIEVGQFQLATHNNVLPMMNAVCLHFLPEKIAYSHERHGRDSPVFLFDLITFDEFTLKSQSDHLCGADRYSVTIVDSPEHIFVHWRIVGPHKNESLKYFYVNQKK